MTKLTIGMATYDDFDGVFFSVQALRLYHPPCEIIVVDNAPHTEASKMLVTFCAMTGTKYIAMPEPVGTSAPRDRIFREAKGEIVFCMDSHVLLAAGSIARLLQWFDDHPDSQDLISGPMVFDDLQNIATHFDDVWRAEMRGIWGQAWQCPCGRWKFSSVQDDALAHCQYRDLATGQPHIACPACTAVLPIVPFPGSVQALEQMGFKRIGLSPDDEPFEVPGQGLGLFGCRREAWLGFNPHFRGFGGEELYIHEKYRRAGRRNLILPFLRWNHRFGRAKTPYALNRYDKIRNYVLGHLELGLSLGPIEEHFVTSGLMPRAEWETLIADPVGATRDAVVRQQPTRPMPPPEAKTEAELVAWCKTVPRDLDQHLETLAALAAQCAHVTEFSARRESTVGLLAAGRLVSYQTEADALLFDLRQRFAKLRLHNLDSPDVSSIEPTDLLFLDTRHNAARVSEELSKFAPAVRRFLVFHDSQIFGPKGDDNGPGLWDALEKFLQENPEWFVYSHTAAQYGLTVLGRLPEDRPAQPVYFKPPGKGPGTELKAILKTLGILENPTCDCNRKANQMDEWAVEGCRAHFDEIVGWMREGQGKWGWKDKLTAAANAVKTGLAFKLNWSDPFPGLIEEAIRRAAEREQGAAERKAA